MSATNPQGSVFPFLSPEQSAQLESHIAAVVRREVEEAQRQMLSQLERELRRKLPQTGPLARFGF